MKLELSYTTKLEAVTDNSSVKAILDAKLEATSPAQLVDYVGLALNHIATKRAEIKDTIKRLQELDKQEANREEFIKEQTSAWLEDVGVDRLDGRLVSSMTVTPSKPKEDLVIDNEDALIAGGYAKMVLDNAMIKKQLLAGVEVEGAHIEVTHTQPKIKINKMRTKPNQNESEVE